MRCVKESFADKFENQQLLKEYQGARKPVFDKISHILYGDNDE